MRRRWIVWLALGSLSLAALGAKSRAKQLVDECRQEFAGVPPKRPAPQTSPLYHTPVPDLLSLGAPKDVLGIGRYFLGEFYDRYVLGRGYRPLEEIVYCALYWPRESKFEADSGPPYIIDFPVGAKRTKDNLYFSSHRRKPGALTYDQQVMRPLEKPGDLRKEIRAHIHKVFEIYLRYGTVPPAEVKRFEEEEAQLSLHRASYFVYRDPVTLETKAVVRLFDGSAHPVTYGGPRGEIETEAGDARLPLERLFPNLKLPERESGEPIYELGRLASPFEVIDPVVPLFRSVTDHFFTKNGFIGEEEPKGMIYATATEAMIEHYTKYYGFEVAQTPEQLGPSPDGTPTYVLKIPVAKFQRQFSVSPNRMPVVPIPH